MTEIELKPCPFCGGEAMISDGEEYGYWRCFCPECGCVVNGSSRKEWAIKQWNRRADDNGEE